MIDLAAALARAFETHLEIGGYRGNRGNPTAEARESAISDEEDAVATANPPVATVATRMAARHPGALASVATVASDQKAVATEDPFRRMAENRELRRPVAAVATVATEIEDETHEAAHGHPAQSSSDLLRAFSVQACLIDDEVTAAAAISDLIAEMDPRLPIGIDVETMPVGEHGDALDPNRAAIRTVQLYAGGSAVAVIDMNQVSHEVLRPLAKVRLVAHNAIFETRFLIAVLGPMLIDCTMLVNRHLGGPPRIGLAELALQCLGVVVPKEHQTADWSGTLTDPMIAYAALDAVLARRLFEVMAPKLLRATPAYSAAIAAQPAIAMASNRGILLDQPLYDDFMHRWAQEHEAAEAELKTSVPEVDFSKPSQVRCWIRSRLSPEQVAKFPKTKKGELSVTQENLCRLAGVIPELDAYARMKDAANKRDRHSNLGSLVNEATGRLHPQFRLCGAVTGRMSCERPNTQSQEKGDGWRRCFPAPERKVMVRGDWSQIELRIAALRANESRMIKVLCTPGGDIHKNTAAAVLRIPIEKVSSEQRQLAKALNFGLLYGMGPRGFMHYAARSFSTKLTLTEATRLREKFFAAYPRLKGWQREHARQVECTLGRSATTVLGRKVKCVRGGQFHYPLSLNAPVQGSGADLMHVALGKLPSALAGLDACPVLFVHDEIVLEVAESNADEARRRLAAVMTEAFVELFPKGKEMVGLVDVTIGKTWGE